MEKIKGTGVALVTPFTPDNQVDVESLRQIVNYVIDGGVDFLVVLGTTSEAPTLTKEEKKLVCQTIIETNKNRVPLVLGIGGNNTQAVIDEIRTVDTSNFVAILSVTPYYNKPSQEGLYAHFAMIASHSPLPIILYNVPGRTGVSMSAELVIRLAKDFEKIVAVKEASGDLMLNMKILKDKSRDFVFLSGDDATTLPSVFMGGDGAISVIANAFPHTFSEMVRLGRKGDINEANKLHYQLMIKTQLAFKEGNPVGIKAFLAQKGLCQPFVRLPLVEATENLKTEIKANI